MRKQLAVLFLFVRSSILWMLLLFLLLVSLRLLLVVLVVLLQVRVRFLCSLLLPLLFSWPVMLRRALCCSWACGVVVAV